MQRLFQSFDRNAVRYLLISGQAAVLYGAASFSEDVDVWIDPHASNVRAFLGALAELDAAVYKLTPPMTVRNVGFGHAFHFLVPDGAGPDHPADVTPRLHGSGRSARPYRRRRPWRGGAAVEVVSIEDLIVEEDATPRRLRRHHEPRLDSSARDSRTESDAPAWAARRTRFERRIGRPPAVARQAHDLPGPRDPLVPDGATGHREKHGRGTIPPPAPSRSARHSGSG
jgi:hypothetical protein